MTRACLDRIAAREGEVHAWAHLDPEAALASARAFDKDGKRGPIAGVPFGVKDIIDTFDMPTEWGTPIHKGRQPERDAACVALSRKAGGILLGKTVTTEFANLHPGPTRNPHDLTRTPGRLVERLGRRGRRLHGADRDRHPDHRLDHPPGFVLRRVRLSADLRRAPHARRHGSLRLARHARHPVALGRRHRALSRRAARHPARADAERSTRPHFALCRSHVWDQFEPATRTLIEDAAHRLARAGARVTELTLPAEFELLNDAHRSISSFEFARTFTWEIENHWNEISDTLRGGRLRDGITGSFEHYIEAKQLADECRRRLDALMGGIDVLLTPAAFGEAPVGMPAFAGVPLFQIWTTLHVPAVSIPVFKGPAGMPIGAQLIAKRHDDRKLFACAQWAFEKLT